MSATPHFQNYTHDSSDPAHRHELDILDMDLGIVNALRRTIMTDIPIPGFMGEGATQGDDDDITIDIHENNGPLHNEIMKHRIGMIPIHFSAEEVDSFDATWLFKLDVSTGPNEKRIVTTHDIRVFHEANDVTASHMRRLFPANDVTGDPILITRLRENERLSFTATPVKRAARDHAGFSPVSLCSFNFIQDPRVASEVGGILEKERAYYKDSRGDPTHIHFSIESECALTPRYLVNKAFDIIIAKVRNNLNLTSPNVVVRPVEAMRMTTPAAKRSPGNANPNDEVASMDKNLGFEYVFANEDDTLGNLLQSIIFNETIRKPPSDVTYVGYYCPHPLDPSMVLRLCTKSVEGTESEVESHVTSIIKAQMQKILALLEMLQTEWNDFAPLE